MTTAPRFLDLINAVEIHISSAIPLALFGAKVRAVGGHYNSCSPMQARRFVHVPLVPHKIGATAVRVIDTILTTQAAENARLNAEPTTRKIAVLVIVRGGHLGGFHDGAQLWVTSFADLEAQAQAFYTARTAAGKMQTIEQVAAAKAAHDAECVERKAMESWGTNETCMREVRAALIGA